MLGTTSAICDLGSRSKQRKDPEEGAELRLVKGQRVVLHRATRWRRTQQPFGLTRVQPKAYKMTRNLQILSLLGYKHIKIHADYLISSEDNNYSPQINSLNIESSRLDRRKRPADCEQHQQTIRTAEHLWVKLKHVKNHQENVEKGTSINMFPQLSYTEYVLYHQQFYY